MVQVFEGKVTCFGMSVRNITKGACREGNLMYDLELRREVQSRNTDLQITILPVVLRCWCIRITKGLVKCQFLGLITRVFYF